MMDLPFPVQTALALLEAAGFEGFVVGGAVRDSVRGAPVTDWDIATSASPAQMHAVFSHYHLVETGIRHGTLTVWIDQTPLEITTYRQDGAYSDHRHPDSVRFTRSLSQDLARRDFTINALAYHPKTGLIDLFGGLSDLARGQIRCVGDPDRRFAEDGLRLLRAVRFASVLGMEVEPATALALHQNRRLLACVSVERIQKELTKMLCGQAAEPMLLSFPDLLAVPLPEILPMVGLDQKNPYHDKDVWAHTAAVVAAAPADPVLRWAALLHDVGKPSCFFTDANGVGHFFGHNETGAQMADEILSRLRFSTQERTRIVTLIRHHGTPLTGGAKQLKRMLHRLGEPAVRQLIALQQADTSGQSPMGRGRLAAFAQIKATLEAVLQEQACFSLRDLAINGNDLIALGFQGKQVGDLLQACLQAVIEERLANDRAALISFARGAASPPSCAPTDK